MTYFWYAERLEHSQYYPQLNQAYGLVVAESAEIGITLAEQMARAALGNTNKISIKQFNRLEG